MLILLLLARKTNEVDVLDRTHKPQCHKCYYHHHLRLRVE